MNRTRREFLKCAGLGAAGLMVPGRARAASNRPPNIVYILADDLGYGDLGCFGGTRIKTPNIDAMCADGVKFTDQYAGNTVCAPSRCNLMTGYHAGHALIRDNGGPALRPEDVTVAEVLKQAGYATGAFGKWGLGENGTTGVPNLQGFDEWFGYLNQSRAHFFYTNYLYKNMQQYPISRRDYTHDLIMGQALDFVRKNRHRPFFLYLPITIPHASLQVPKESFELTDEMADRAYWGGHYTAAQSRHRMFAGMIEHMDRDVGRLLSYISDLGLDEDTIVFFTSDNGAHDEGGADKPFFQASGKLRGFKRSLYDGGIRAPMIVRWPGHTTPGTVSAEPWAFYDFLATAADLADVAEPPGLDGIPLDGISMVPAITGGQQTSHEYLYFEWPNGGVLRRAVRKGKWKGVRLGATATIELYDLSVDIGETNDIAGANPDIVSDIEAIMDSARVPSPYWV